MKKALSLILIAFIVGCAPSRLVPYDYTIEQNNLQTFIELDEATITIENLQVKNDHFVFGIGIRNKRETPMLIDSDRILKFANYVSYQEGDIQRHSQEVAQVLSPQQTLELFENKRKDAKTAGFLLFLMGAAITTFDVIQDAKDNSKDSWTRSDQRRSVNRDIVTGVSLLASDVLSEATLRDEENAEIELNYLPEELFDRKVIDPGEEYYGKIFFKKSDQLHKYHRISWPIQSISLFFDFRLATRKERKFLRDQGLD